ncbi:MULTISPECIES: phosphatase PAP2 family protein [Flammeovirga]|uniref:Phosphatase PAP2 family protein n=1 Tax=Flammeovirga agarivorans TaxID=2726742 RepID=A0A7X8XVG3_9BACT|nr:MULTISPECIES: phosphatase PAP2 family protein [Flammeovirga]NLR91219.1 phosphatase PAP2 family protein [Flammeovirga agarivorans]
MQPFEWERELFLFLNGHHNEASDAFFWWLTTPVNSWPLYVFLIGFSYWKFGWKNTLMTLIGVGIAIGLADVIASQIFKPLVNRPRPSHDSAIADLVHTLHGYRGGPLGFVSSHASTSMAIALFFFLEWKNKVKGAALLFIWTALYSYSRIAVGVHFVGDILGGWIVGILAVYLSRLILREVTKRYPQLKT